MNATSINTVWTLVFQRLPQKDLFLARGVSMLWNNLATPLIRSVHITDFEALPNLNRFTILQEAVVPYDAQDSYIFPEEQPLGQCSHKLFGKWLVAKKQLKRLAFNMDCGYAGDLFCWIDRGPPTTACRIPTRVIFRLVPGRQRKETQFIKLSKYFCQLSLQTFELGCVPNLVGYYPKISPLIKTLKEFSLSYNGYAVNINSLEPTLVGFGKLWADLNKHQFLRVLKLHHNQLSVEDLKSLAAVLPATSLETFTFTRNQIDAKAFDASPLFVGIGKCKSLRDLQLSSGEQLNGSDGWWAYLVTDQSKKAFLSMLKTRKLSTFKHKDLCHKSVRKEVKAKIQEL